MIGLDCPSGNLYFSVKCNLLQGIGMTFDVISSNGFSGRVEATKRRRPINCTYEILMRHCRLVGQMKRLLSVFGHPSIASPCFRLNASSRTVGRSFGRKINRVAVVNPSWKLIGKLPGHCRAVCGHAHLSHSPTSQSPILACTY
jgi:hypothetical protein